MLRICPSPSPEGLEASSAIAPFLEPYGLEGAILCEYIEFIELL
jgi:hypothetical protein